MRIVIAGFGVGGATAAEEARKRDPGAEITVFSRENELFYTRMRLPELVGGALGREKLSVRQRHWYEERRISLHLGESVESLEFPGVADASGGTARGSAGTECGYDRLLLATGAECNRLDLPGADLRGVFTVHSLADAEGLKAYAAGRTRAVFIGGGLLGLEMAYALTSLGLEVTVVERGDRLLPRQTTPASAALLVKKLEALGMSFVLGGRASRFTGSGRVEKAVLADGAELDAELAVISAGIAPNLDLGRRLGLKIERAIVVDERMETSMPGVFAVGDCAQYAGRPGGLWTVARSQGLVAGANLVAGTPGECVSYVPEAPSNVLKIAGIDCMAAGDLDPDGKMRSAEAASGGAYRKVVFDAAGRVAGFTTLGSTAGNRQLGAAMQGGRVFTPDEMEALKNMDFDFSRLS